MLARMFQQQQRNNNDVEQVADMLINDPDKDWTQYIDGLLSDGRLDFLEEVEKHIRDLQLKAYDCLATTGNVLFKILMINMHAETAERKTGEPIACKQLCEDIATEIAARDRTNSLMSRVGTAHLAHNHDAFHKCVQGFDNMQSIIYSAAKIIPLLEARKNEYGQQTIHRPTPN